MRLWGFMANYVNHAAAVVPSVIVFKNAYVCYKFIRTKRSELALLAHSVLREVEKMGYKKIFARTHLG